MIRSYLFVPGDKPEMMRKAMASAADAVIFDLEDSVAPASKDRARTEVAAFLKARGDKKPVFVRVNPLSRGMVSEDLEAVLPCEPEGLVLPKAEGADCVSRFAQLTDDAVRLLPIVSETAKAIFQIGSYSNVAKHICGMTWGAEDLSAAVGATVTLDTAGRYRAPYELVRSLTLFGSHAAGVDAIEAVYPVFRDMEGLDRHARRAREDGFAAMMAIHPSQIPIINDAFSYSAAEIREAETIVSMFSQNACTGALSLDGRMIDAPHLARAQAILAKTAGAGDRKQG